MWLLNPYRFAAGYTPTDANAAAYLAAVEAADGQPLEPGVRLAIDRFVIGCKSDGTWNAIKASCILAGARTLAGALQPLVGTAPTNINFVAGDYNRKTGLAGDGSTKYLDSNRANNADPQDNKHIAVFVTSAASGTAYALMGSLIRTPATSVTQIFHALGGVNTGTQSSINLMLNFIGISRSNSANQVVRSNGVSTVATSASNAHHNLNAFIFARNDGGSVNSHTNARIAFYSIGESLDIALLDFRVTALRNALAAAIP